MKEYGASYSMNVPDKVCVEWRDDSGKKHDAEFDTLELAKDFMETEVKEGLFRIKDVLELWLGRICEEARAGTFTSGVYSTNPNEVGLCIAVGWTEGYEESPKLIQQMEGETRWTLSGKVAHNSGALRCDYDGDWLMPIAESDDGDVFDTSIAIVDERDIKYLSGELEFATEEVKKGRLKIV